MATSIAGGRIYDARCPYCGMLEPGEHTYVAGWDECNECGAVVAPLPLPVRVPAPAVPPAMRPNYAALPVAADSRDDTIARLREALGRYGTHEAGCAYYDHVGLSCDCGLDAALEVQNGH